MFGNTDNDIEMAKMPNTYGSPSPAYLDNPYGASNNNLNNNAGAGAGAGVGMGGMAGAGIGVAAGMAGGNMLAGMGMVGINPNTFYFNGNSLSLRARLESINDADLEKYADAQITVTGQQIQSMNQLSLCCVMIWGSFLIFPLFFLCMGWWKKCTYPAHSVNAAVYQSICNILRGSNIRNMTLRVNDNLFNAEKAHILYNGLVESKLAGFTFVNMAGDYNFNGKEWSDFERNMAPIKGLTNIISEIRWDDKLVQ